MYLSLLKLNPRSRRAMTETSRPYELHRSIMTAFPTSEDKILGRILFRLDADRKNGNMSVLVQSQDKPDWAALNGAGNLLLEQPKCKTFEPDISPGMVLYFRLRANPSVKRNGKRLGIKVEEEQTDWLQRKAKDGGFRVISVTVIPEGMAKDKMTDRAGLPHNMNMLSVCFEGFLQVTEAGSFRRTLEQGVGSAKGMGFGLLSLAPIKEQGT